MVHVGLGAKRKNRRFHRTFRLIGRKNAKNAVFIVHFCSSREPRWEKFCLLGAQFYLGEGKEKFEEGKEKFEEGKEKFEEGKEKFEEGKEKFEEGKF